MRLFHLHTIRKIYLVFNTLKYLKWQQIYFRLFRKFIKPKVTESFQGPKPHRPIDWKHQSLYNDKIDKNLEACFLNYAKKLELPADWDNESPSKLWVYNLHYFEDLLAENAHKKRELHKNLLDLWIDQNPIGLGNGWEPYPTSLRIVNILKAWLGGLDLKERNFRSVFAQASLLSNNLERHLLGNHYFSNLKALFFAGIIFKNKRWLSIAEKALLTEIPEQILKDGANFELSPMYHSLMVVDMLDMLNLSRVYPVLSSSRLVYLFEDYIPKMLNFMEAMSHPDGKLSFFNDSVDGISPTKERINKYAKKLGFEITASNSNDLTIIDNVKSGYFCASVADSKLIFDASPIGPDYIPGHGHADTLSFELSIGNQKVFVNSGTSEYGLTQTRVRQRKTISHNTVEIDGKDSSQVWSSFRVANRAKIIARHAEVTNDQAVVLYGAHNGYKSLFNGCVHSRKLVFKKGRLAVNDYIKGRFKTGKFRLYFHPDLLINFQSDLLSVRGSNFTLQSDMSGKSVALLDSFWYPEFGIKIPNKALEINFVTSRSEVDFGWSRH